MLYPNNWAGLFICEAMLTNHNFTLYIAKVENFSETTSTLSHRPILFLYKILNICREQKKENHDL